MKFKVLFAITFVFLTINVSIAADIHVYPGDTIQNAINTAIPGVTIIIHSGTYTENVNVNKPLTII